MSYVLWGLSRYSIYDENSSRTLARVLEHPGVPDRRKKRLAAEVVGGIYQSDPQLTGTNWHLFLGTLCAAGAHRPDPERANLAQMLLRREKAKVDALPPLAGLIRSIGDAPTREQLQDQIYLPLVAAAVAVPTDSDAETLLAPLAEAIVIDRGQSLALLSKLVEYAAANRGMSQESMDYFAVLSFQIDPEGKAVQPGAHDNGARFSYPPELAQRRALLHATQLPAITGRLANAMSPMLGVWDVAMLAEQYAGPGVAPSDWPELLATLENARGV